LASLWKQSISFNSKRPEPRQCIRVKSGGNQFHGSGFEYFRNTALDARGFFAPVRPVEHQNEFGFNISGPVKKDKIFFFANYDGFRFTQAAQPSFCVHPDDR
jgi:hypothetical protein